MDALQFSVMICCLIMISMQCCCRYYLHPRQKIGCIIQALILSADRTRHLTGWQGGGSQSVKRPPGCHLCRHANFLGGAVSTSHVTCQLEAGATLLYILSLSPILANFQLRGSIFGKGHPVTRARHLPVQSIYFFKEYCLGIQCFNTVNQWAIVTNSSCL